MLGRFSVRQVITGTMAALALVAFSAVIMLIVTASSSRRALELQSVRLVADRGTADRMIQRVQEQLAYAHDYMDHGDPRQLEQFRTAGIAAYDELRRYLLRPLTSEERLLVERIRERHEAIEVEAQRVFAAREDASLSRDLPGADALRADLDALLELRLHDSDRLIESQRAVWRWIYAACAVLGLAFMLVFIVAVSHVRRRVLEPLDALAAAVQRVGAGDFEARVEAGGEDELATVGRSFNSMAERLRAAREHAEHSELRLRELVDGLQASEERYHSLFDRVPVGLYRTTPDGRMNDANSALVAMLGFDSREAVLNANAADMYIDADERAGWQAMLAASDGVVEVDRRHRRQDGAIIWLRDTARAVRDGSGTVRYYEGALQDVTERVRAEEALRHSEARFRSLIENARDGVLILSRDGSIAYESPSIERMLGYEPLSGGGLRPFDHVHPEDQERVREAFASLGTGSADAVEFRYRHRDGSWRLLHATGSNLLDDPVVDGYVINISDATAQRQLEEQLQHAQKMEAVGRLAGGIAHDFNNLLTAIQGYTDLLGDRTDPGDEAQGDLYEIRNAVERAARLTRQLLAFSRRQVVRPRSSRCWAGSSPRTCRCARASSPAAGCRSTRGSSSRSSSTSW
jgi:PAS domain S-box-containing protein